MKRMPFNVRAINIKLPAAQTMKVNALDYFYLATADGDLEISADGQTFAPLQTKRGFRATPGDIMGEVIIRNNTGGTVTGTALTGYGSNIDNADTAAGGTVDVEIVAPLPLEVQGDVAHDAPVAGNPVLVGGAADTTEPGNVADGDAVRAFRDPAGRAVVTLAPVGGRLAGSLSINAAVAADIIAAQAAGLRIHMTQLIASNEGAAAEDVIILNGAAELFRFRLAVGASICMNFPTPEETTAATALRANVVTGGNMVRLRAKGYVGA